MADAWPQWLQAPAFVTVLLGLELVVGVFLWHAPIVLDRRDVHRLRPLALGLVVVAGAVTIALAIVGEVRTFVALLLLPSLAYVAYTWSDAYLDRLDSAGSRAAGGRRIGRWRREAERRTRDS